MCKGNECDDAVRDFKHAAAIEAAILAATLTVMVFFGAQTVKLIANPSIQPLADAEKELAKQIVTGFSSTVSVASIVLFIRSIQRTLQFRNAVGYIRRDQRLGPKISKSQCPNIREWRRKVWP